MTTPEFDSRSHQPNFDSITMSQFSEPTPETIAILHELLEGIKADQRTVQQTHAAADSEEAFTTYALTLKNAQGLLIYSAHEASIGWLEAAKQSDVADDQPPQLFSVHYFGPIGSGRAMTFEQRYGEEPVLFIGDATISKVESREPPRVLDLAAGTLGGVALSEMSATDPFYTSSYRGTMPKRRTAEANGATHLTESGVQRFIATISKVLVAGKDSHEITEI